eukprot:5427951-Amphidinium_carterae.1
MDATSDQITDIITILFCAPRSSFDNPSYSHAQHNAPRTFLLIQQGGDGVVSDLPFVAYDLPRVGGE